MDVYMHAIPAVEDDAADQIADLMFTGTDGHGDAPADDDSPGDQCDDEPQEQ